MSEKAKKEEVPKFSYKLSLDQPFWIQQLTDNFCIEKGSPSFLICLFFLNIHFAIFYSWKIDSIFSMASESSAHPFCIMANFG